MKNEKTFKVPVMWKVKAEVEVTANDYGHACEVAECEMGLGLPEGEFIQGSFKVIKNGEHEEGLPLFSDSWYEKNLD